jgi:hypothetical protein
MCICMSLCLLHLCFHYCIVRYGKFFTLSWRLCITLIFFATELVFFLNFIFASVHWNLWWYSFADRFWDAGTISWYLLPKKNLCCPSASHRGPSDVANNGRQLASAGGSPMVIVMWVSFVSRILLWSRLVTWLCNVFFLYVMNLCSIKINFYCYNAEVQIWIKI